jgi:SpoIIAA-like
VIEPIGDLVDGVIGISAVGQFNIDDYNAIIEPALDKRVGDDKKLRLLLYLGPEFKGFGEGAWGDLTDEIRHTHFHRGAVVTDEGYIRAGINVLKWMLHGDVRTFQNDEYDKAMHWVAG